MSSLLAAIERGIDVRISRGLEELGDRISFGFENSNPNGRREAVIELKNHPVLSRPEIRLNPILQMREPVIQNYLPEMQASFTPTSRFPPPTATFSPYWK